MWLGCQLGLSVRMSLKSISCNYVPSHKTQEWSFLVLSSMMSALPNFGSYCAMKTIGGCTRPHFFSPDFEIFAIRDEQQSRYEGSGMYEMLTAASINRSHGRTICFSRLLKEYFDEDDTRLAYPSLLLFLVYSGKVSKCRLVPLSYGTIDAVFDQLRALFSVISDTIAAWRDSDGTSVDTLWTSLKKSLLEKDYTLYIQNAPSTAGDAVERLAPFMT